MKRWINLGCLVWAVGSAAIAETEPPPIEERERATESPDGAWITKEDFPSQIARRGITLPEGMFRAGLSAGLTAASGSSALSPSLGMTMSAGYAPARNFNLGLSVPVLLTPVASEGVGLDGTVQLTRNLGLLATAFYQLIPSANGYPVQARARLSIGIPLKFSLARDLAIGGLDSVFYWYQPIWAAPGAALPASSYRVFLPVYVQYNFLPTVAAELRWTLGLPYGSATTFSNNPNAALYYTASLFDLGLQLNLPDLVVSPLYTISLIARLRW